jgi:hypothetical protein
MLKKDVHDVTNKTEIEYFVIRDTENGKFKCLFNWRAVLMFQLAFFEIC